MKKWVIDPNNTISIFMGVKYPHFNLKGLSFLSEVILNSIMNPFRNKKVCALLKKWALDPKNTKNHVFGVKHPFFHLKDPVLISGMMTNQFWNLFREKAWG